ncbi:MAG: glycosyltransferase, partial [Enterococcus sp.]|nr:glycosyltransferase [Enterococcus sp.]
MVMLIEQLSQYISDKEPIKSLWDKLNSGEDSQLAVSSSARAFLISARFNYLPQSTLVVCSGTENAKNLANDLMNFLSVEDVLYFPNKSHVAGSNIISEDEQYFYKEITDATKVEHAQRNVCLNALAENQNKIIVTDASNLADKLPSKEAKHFQPIKLKANEELSNFNNLEEFQEALVNMGYKYNFTFIIPHKNLPELLKRCVLSIPRRDDVQIIIVDDNSDPDEVDFENFPFHGEPNINIIFDKTGKRQGHARNV